MTGCEELLKVAPGEGAILKLYKKARDHIIKQNIEKIDAQIDAAKPLWKEKKYQELLQIYSKLIEFAPEYKKLHRLLKKAHKKAVQQHTKQKEEVVNQYIAAIKKALKSKYWEEARKLAKDFKAATPNLGIASEYVKLVENTYVEDQLEANQAILNSERYEEIMLIYEGLLQKAPWHKKILKMLQNAQKDFIYHQRDLKLRMVKSGTLKIKILYNTGKYEECQKVCLENLRVNDQNELAQDYLKKAKKKLVGVRNKKVIEIVKAGFTSLEPYYTQNPQGFVTI
jgi:hypothetical protein